MYCGMEFMFHDELIGHQQKLHSGRDTQNAVNKTKGNKKFVTL